MEVLKKEIVEEVLKRIQIEVNDKASPVIAQINKELGKLTGGR